MARQQTPQTYQDLFAQYTDAAFITLVVLSVPDRVTPGNYNCYHLTNNVVDVRSTAQDGATEQVYVAFPMALTFPTDQNGQISGATFAITNVSRDVIDFIHQTATGMTVEMILVNSKELNTVVRRDPCYRWIGVTYDAMTISGQLSVEDYLSESYPSKVMGPANFPGLF